MYRQTSPSSPVRFIEIYNTTNSSIDLTGYSIAGDITYNIPSGNTIAPLSFIIIAANSSQLKATYNINQHVKVVGNWTGSLALDTGVIQLVDAGRNIVDELEYKGWGLWPNTAIDTGKSIQKINPVLSSHDGGSWDKGTPTPGASNQEVLVSNPNTLPIVRQISHEPHQPKADEEVLITAMVINTTSNTNLVLEYQLIDPGNYISKNDDAYNNNWTSLAMNDNGIGGDGFANDGIFSVKMSSNLQTNRRLIRYRISVNNNLNYNKIFPDQSFDESNFSYFIYDKHVTVNGYNINQLNELQTFFFITKGIDNDYTNFPSTVIIDTIIYDHVDIRKTRYYWNPRRNYQVNFNAGRPAEVADDFGNKYQQKRDRLNLSGTDMCDKSSHGLTESLIFKIFELTETVASYADYAQLRFIEDSNPDSDFEGIHVLRDYTRHNKDVDGDFLKLRDLPDGNIYGYKAPFGILHDGELAPYGHFNQEYNEWNEGWDDFSDGCSSCTPPIPPLDFLEEKIDLDNHFGFMASQEFIANNETNYGGQHNYYEYYNPISKKILVIPDDFNATFGTPRDENGFALRSEFDPTEDIRGPFKQAIIHYESLRVEFENHVRSGLDLLLNTEQSALLVDNEVKKIYNPNKEFNWTDVDQSKHNQNYTTYEEVIKDYKVFFIQRANHLKAIYGSSKMPNKPVISYTGSANVPIDQLTFTTSNFMDPQGNNTFASMEWRIGEWSDPNNLVYEALHKDIYEITPVWHSGDIPVFSNSYTIQNANLTAGRTYRIRVRYKDNTGRKSYWSDPIEFIPPSVNQNIPPENFCTRINASADDAEENIANGAMNLTSGDLDLVNDQGEISVVGLRFKYLFIHQGAFVRNATIQFTADEANTEFTSLTIRGEATNNALAFTANNKNISNRSTTNASVVWTPDSWSQGTNGLPEKSINIAPIIREIINRPGFVTGNSIAIIIEGTGIRTAESFDGFSILAPELCLDYIPAPCIVGAACDDGDPNTTSTVYDANCNCTNTDIVKAKVLLEGYYDATTSQMKTQFQEKNLFPLNQPFNTAPWNYTGTERAIQLPTEAVDWVLLVLRDNNGAILNQATGFINQKGELIDIEGNKGIFLSGALDNYISIHPRGHLAVLSSSPYAGTMYDFTTNSTSAAGVEQLKLISGKYMLYAGDYDGSGIINSLDFNNWKVNSALINAYLPIDGDGNGIINASDYNLWIINKAKVGEPVIRY